MITIFIHTLILLLIYPYLVRYENKGNTEDHRKQFFLFLHTSKLQQKVKQQIFPLGTFSMFFFSLPKISVENVSTSDSDRPSSEQSRKTQ